LHTSTLTTKYTDSSVCHLQCHNS